MTIVYTSPDQTYRIVEHPDHDSTLADLKGDCYNPKYVTDIEPDVLKRDELRFEKQVERDGVFGYVLEKWDPTPNCGWEHVDSCWGFVGEYNEGAEGYDHYIVDEMIAQVPK